MPNETNCAINCTITTFMLEAFIIYYRCQVDGFALTPTQLLYHVMVLCPDIPSWASSVAGSALREPVESLTSVYHNLKDI